MGEEKKEKYMENKGMRGRSHKRKRGLERMKRGKEEVERR